MSKYTAEQARDWHRRESSWRNQLGMYESERKHSDMADAIDALLRERESAKAGVTDEMIECAARAMQRKFDPSSPFEDMTDNGKWRRFVDEARCCLEAVAPMLASARVPEELVVVDEVGRIEFDSTGQLDVNWSIEGGPNGVGVGAILLVADRKITDDEGYGEVYAAAPKPETIWPKNAREKAFSLAREMLKKGSAKPEKE